MPTYEYKCNACGREFEVQQRMSDDELTDCEVCGQKALERLISRTAFSLKGGGWYKDLYASTKPEAKSSETKTETKPDAGTTTAAPAAPSTSSTPSTPSTPSGGSSSGSGSGGSSGSKAAAGAS